MKKAINLSVNGVAHTDEVEPRMLLVHYLRDVLELTGTHVGCETSLCGACTVMLDGQAVKSCTVFAVQADGSSVTTIDVSSPSMVGKRAAMILRLSSRSSSGLPERRRSTGRESRAFVPAFRRERFGPFPSSLRSFTPPLVGEGQQHL